MREARGWIGGSMFLLIIEVDEYCQVDRLGADALVAPLHVTSSTWRW